MAEAEMSLTEAAAARVKALMASSETPVLGLRVGVQPKGCSGMTYTMEFVNEQQPHETLIEDKGVRIFIHPMAIMFLIGTEMDYREDKMGSRFVFTNPNEKARCGCGESFHV
ncbi:MAG: iron-sulfur cluster assembly accessory protein [Alphaproteobacteria bacterium]|nr:iron-sulfur cluster assembly accessory protein [Alphaproteobacteria bacterium]